MAGNRMPLREGIYYNSALSCLESPVGDIHLTPNEKKILEIILAKRGRKETIIEEIWHQQGIVVSESSYHQLVKMIRRKFVAAGMPSSSLKTIPRYGVVYRTNAEADADNDEPFYDKNLNFSESVSEGQTFYSINEMKTAVIPLKPIKISNLSAFSIFSLSSLILLLVLSTHDTTEYFRQVKQAGNVNYFVAPATKVSPTLWQRIEQQVSPATREIYIASNGPKVWVAYCEKNIYKDNAPCNYEHFSVY